MVGDPVKLFPSYYHISYRANEGFNLCQNSFLNDTFLFRVVAPRMYFFCDFSSVFPLQLDGVLPLLAHVDWFNLLVLEFEGGEFSHILSLSTVLFHQSL